MIGGSKKKKKKGVTIIDGVVHVVVEYCEKKSLEDWLRKSHDMLTKDISTLLNLAIGAAYSLLLLENKQVIHCDIATRNFLLKQDLTVKLNDFGMSSTETVYVADADIMFPWPWASPEVCEIASKKKIS